MARQSFFERELALLCLSYCYSERRNSLAAVAEGTGRGAYHNLPTTGFVRHENKTDFCTADRGFRFCCCGTGVRHPISHSVDRRTPFPLTFTRTIGAALCNSNPNGFGLACKERAHQFHSAAVGRNDQPRHL